MSNYHLKFDNLSFAPLVLENNSKSLHCLTANTPYDQFLCSRNFALAYELLGWIIQSHKCLYFQALKTVHAYSFIYLFIFVVSIPFESESQL